MKEDIINLSNKGLTVEEIAEWIMGTVLMIQDDATVFCLTCDYYLIN